MKIIPRYLLVVLAIFISSTLSAKKIPTTYDNPILTGYHPDPSICRKGDDFYIVNSSFEWFPGLPIHKSKDLVNWELIGYAMTRAEDCPKYKINTFAPTIRYHDGLFYIINTNVGSGGNFYITAKDPAGEWSSPVWLPDAPGIDPSIFWDDDGKCYYIGQEHANPRKWTGHNNIWMQELDLKQGKLVGERKNLTSGHAANAMWTEGPHLYKIDGKYLLLLAEGGTSYHHAVTIFHSETLWGTYTPDHANPILTHRHLGESYPTYAIGHADFVDTPNGEWWMVALGKRVRNGYAYLARETFLIPIKLERRKGVTAEDLDDYQTIIVNEGVGIVPNTAKRPNLPWTPVKELAPRDEFDGEDLALRWNFRSVPKTQWHSLGNGVLKVNLRGEKASDKWSNPSIIAQRVRDFAFEATLKMEFSAAGGNEQAGLTLYRSDMNHIIFTIKGENIVVERRLESESKELYSAPYKDKSVILRLKSDGKDVTFYYGDSEKKLTKINATAPLSIISDLQPTYYNGTMVGVYASSNGVKSTTIAKFDWFELRYNQ